MAPLRDFQSVGSIPEKLHPHPDLARPRLRAGRSTTCSTSQPRPGTRTSRPSSRSLRAGPSGAASRAPERPARLGGCEPEPPQHDRIAVERSSPRPRRRIPPEPTLAASWRWRAAISARALGAGQGPSGRRGRSCCWRSPPPRSPASNSSIIRAWQGESTSYPAVTSHSPSPWPRGSGAGADGVAVRVPVEPGRHCRSGSRVESSRRFRLPASNRAGPAAAGGRLRPVMGDDDHHPVLGLGAHRPPIVSVGRRVGLHQPLLEPDDLGPSMQRSAELAGQAVSSTIRRMAGVSWTYKAVRSRWFRRRSRADPSAHPVVVGDGLSEAAVAPLEVGGDIDTDPRRTPPRG